MQWLPLCFYEIVFFCKSFIIGGIAPLGTGLPPENFEKNGVVTSMSVF